MEGILIVALIMWVFQTGNLPAVGLIVAGWLALRLAWMTLEGAFYLTRAWDPRAALLFWIAVPTVALVVLAPVL
jgi:hypothetical protein